MSSLKGKKILIFQQRGWGKGIGRMLARDLFAEGCRIAAFTSKRSTHELILREQEAKYELVINNDELLSRPKEMLGGSDYTLEEICNDLGIDSIWPIVMSLRQYVRSYKDKYFYGFKQNVSDEGIIDYIKVLYKHIKIIFEEFRPDVIIAPNFVSFHHVMFNLYAERHGAKMMAMTDSKVRGMWLVVHGFEEKTGPFFDHLQALNQGKIESPNREKAKKYIADFRTHFQYPDYINFTVPKKNIIASIKYELSPYIQILRWIKNPPTEFLDIVGVTTDNRGPRYILRDFYASKKYKKMTDKFSYFPFEKVKKYVYFPLQVQPEIAIDVAAPYFSNQIETARQVAMSLPGDYTLVVKEHPNMVGLRPPSYLEKVARTVNVKLIDYRVPTELVVKNADMVICTNGTTLAEAAFYNKPAIQLGNFGTTLQFPNVVHHTDMTTLTQKIKEVLNMNCHSPEYEYRLENYVAAVYDTGFDVNYIGAWEKGEKESMKRLCDIYKEQVFNISSQI